jgi:hypothetical protein
MSVETLVQKAKEAGAETIALTDINNSTGIPDFAGEYIKNSIKPVAGIEFRAGNDLIYIGLARNNKGLLELNEFLSDLNILNKPLPFPAPAFTESYIIYPSWNVPLRNLYDNEFIGIKRNELNRLLVAKNSGKDKMVILQPVTFCETGDIFIHKCLRAVDKTFSSAI